MATLAARLIGTWRLVRYEARRADGDVICPMGTDCVGYISYQPDGRIWVQQMVPGRPAFAVGDIAGATAEEYAAAARGYFAYCGTWETDEAGGAVIHHVELSLVPNWVGSMQWRNVRWIGKRLELSGSPTLIAGETRAAHLLWERAS
jgi:Lipocalin-like domain